MELKTRNVNTAFHDLVKVFAGQAQDVAGTHGVPIVKRPSRNGDVVMIDEPVMVTYSHPRERVLFNTARDANPFMHVYEALWMLAGRNDVAPLAYYAKQFREYSDDGVTLNGAYGYRWRRAERYEWSDTGYAYRSEVVDQLDILVNHLKADPNSRRAVLSMWNVGDDLLKIGPGEGTSRDTCCNLNVMFSLRRARLEEETMSDPGECVICPEFLSPGRNLDAAPPKVFALDITVTNRSNDMIWGMLGANYVHFTMLQEYMAARLGVEVGRYTQFTNNLHVYSWNWAPEKWLADTQQDWYGKGVVRAHGPVTNVFPLVKDPAAFDKELPAFVRANEGIGSEEDRTGWTEPFLKQVAQPMLAAFHFHKAGDRKTALNRVKDVAADDWCIAATNWLNKRNPSYVQTDARAE